MNFLYAMIMIVVLIMPISVHSQEVYNELAASLAENGHRDIMIAQQGDSLFVSVWPYGFRDPYRGFMNALKIIRSNEIFGINNQSIKLALTITQWGLPTVTGFLNNNKSLHRTVYSRAYHLKNNFDDSRVDYQASKFNLLFDIPFSYSLGGIEDPLVFNIGLRPEVRVRLFRTLIAYAEASLFLHNEFDNTEWFKPGNIGIVYSQSIINRLISITNIGAFRSEIYGFDQTLQLSVQNDRILFRLHGGFYGDLFYEDNMFFYDDLNHSLVLGETEISFPKVDARLIFQTGRYLYGDRGGSITIERTFDEIDIGFTGMRTDGVFIAKINISIPFYPRTRSSRARFGVGLHDKLHFGYRSDSSNRGEEPILPMSIGRIEKNAAPSHFNNMTNYYPSKK
jgi:hypothetical protein